MATTDQGSRVAGGSTSRRSARPSSTARVSGHTDPQRFRRVLKHALLIVLGVVMVYPLLWMILASFKPTDEIFSGAGLLPQTWTLDNYITGWNGFGLSFGTFFLNSFLVTAAAVVGNIVSCSLAAYAFARLNFRFKRFWFAAMLFTLMLPHHVSIVPQYVLFDAFGWINTFLPLIVPKLLATDAFFIFLMVQFMRALPRELDEAAEIDGCGPYRTYLRVILPLTMPAITTTAVFTFIWTWSDFFTPLIYLTDPTMYTVPLGLNAFRDSTGESSWGALFAMATLSLGPVLGFFIAAQKYLVRGIATTGMK
jgi:multiple sugar transport system permease protein